MKIKLHLFLINMILVIVLIISVVSVQTALEKYFPVIFDSN